jgi:hypothetical protein
MTNPLATAIVIVFAALASVSNYTLSDEPSRPNIVFILTDDHRWDGVTCSGNDLIRTPNLDQICNSITLGLITC